MWDSYEVRIEAVLRHELFFIILNDRLVIGVLFQFDQGSFRIRLLEVLEYVATGHRAILRVIRRVANSNLLDKLALPVMTVVCNFLLQWRCKLVLLIHEFLLVSRLFVVKLEQVLRILNLFLRLLHLRLEHGLRIGRDCCSHWHWHVAI